jgi:hypothetical protein
MHKKAEELMFADLLRFREDGRIDFLTMLPSYFPANLS